MKNTGNIALVLCICFFAYTIIDKTTGSNNKKVGVVQMEKLVYDFKGMKEATERYSVKMKKWSDESDSLEYRLKSLVQQIKADSISNNREKLEQHKQMFTLCRKSLVEFMQTAQENAQKEDRQMTIGVINQVNEYIKTYAQNEGYDVILCNSQNQSVGYAREQIDITQQVLAFANDKYEGLK